MRDYINATYLAAVPVAARYVQAAWHLLTVPALVALAITPVAYFARLDLTDVTAGAALTALLAVSIHNTVRAEFAPVARTSEK